MTRGTRTSLSGRILLLIGIVLCAPLDYMQVMGFPAWAIYGLVVLPYVGLNPKYLGQLKVALRTPQIRRMLVLWLLFILAVVVSDTLNDALGYSLDKIVIYSFITMLVFMLMAVLSMRMEGSDVDALFLVIAVTGGLTAIMQFMGLEWAWRVPETIQAYSGVSGSGETLKIEAGRARGIHILVHKFGAYQAILVSWLMCRYFERKGGGSSVTRTPGLLLGLFVSFMGVALTFSRSPLVGLAVAALLILYMARPSARQVFVGAILFGLLLGGGYILGIHDSPYFTRYYEKESTLMSDYLRRQGYDFALQSVKESPIVGSGTLVGYGILDTTIHSVPIRVLANYGLFGISTYAGVILALLALYLRTMKFGTHGIYVGIAAVSALSVGMVDSAFHTSGFLRYDIAQPALFGVIAGQCLSIIAAGRGKPGPRPALRPGKSRG